MSRAKISIAIVTQVSEISPIDSNQPSFVKNLVGRDRMMARSETSRSGDIRVEDLFPGAIKDIHIDSLTANKLTAGTIDADIITVQSADGKMTLAGNVFTVKDASNVIQVSMGKYSGSNYGIAIGSNPASPEVVISSTGIEIQGANAFGCVSPAGAIFYNSSKSVNSLLKYVINLLQFTIGGGTGVLNINGDLAVGAQNPSLGGGHDLIFLSEAATVPTSNPSNGGLLYVQGGALKYRGTAGTITPIAAA